MGISAIAAWAGIVAVATAVIAVAVSISGSASEDRIQPGGLGADGPCGEFRLENDVLPLAGETDRALEMLSPPYVATMGARLDNGNQVSALRLTWTSDPPEEALTVVVAGPVHRELVIDAPDTTLIRVTLGTPGDYLLTLEGELTGCVTQITVRAELDTDLRTYDASRGLTAPPPADMQ